MRERPILFSGAMVRAILAGTKTQTRRALRGVSPPCQPEYDSESGLLEWFAGDEVFASTRCPYGAPGDRLVVREAWRYANWTEDGEPWIQYRADDSMRLCTHTPLEWADRLMDTWAALSVGKAIGEPAADSKWRPSIHMPRWASRITLEVTGVRVERLQDISEADAVAEGCASKGAEELPAIDQARTDFQELWTSINGPGSWDANPWVWVVEFRRITAADAAREG